MKILVTGSDGFIGGHVSARLKDQGHEVVSFDIHSGGDVMNKEIVEEAIADGVQVVYHVAAQADLTKIRTHEDAYLCTELNVTGTHNVAYACAKHKAWMVYASTCCVYGNQEVHPAFEDTSLPNPSELYAFTKLAGEEIMRGYGINFGMVYTILRFATIYGPGMRPALATHIFFDQAYAGADITVHGTGKQDRTQTYIDDLVEGIVRVHDHPESQGQVINLTAPDSISANKMAEDIKRITESPSRIVYVADRPHQTYHEEFNVEKAKALLGGWYARTSWEDGLRKTAEWLEKERGYARWGSR